VTTFRLAHYSDIHVTVPPLALAPGTLRGKRLVGAVNYAIARRKHFADVETRIARLLEAVDVLAPDHALCTGDLTAISAREEFERCARLFGDRSSDPSRLTVLPGNHDRYTPDTVRDRLFERHFEAVCAGPGGVFPFLKRLREDVVLVGVDVARPCSLLDSSGLCGDRQLEALRGLLASADLRGRFVIVALHYGLLRSDGARDRPRHGIRDDVKLLELLARDEVRVDLVLHGHMHRPYTVMAAGRRVVCAGSATDLHGRCGFNAYSIDPARRVVGLERHVWDRGAGRYVADDRSPFPREIPLDHA